MALTHVKNDTYPAVGARDILWKMSSLNVCRKTSLLLGLLAVVITTGCTSNLTRFDIVHRLKKSGALDVSRYEVAAQGGGAASSANYSLERATVGGSYLRSNAAAGASDHAVSAGLHGKPDAIE